MAQGILNTPRETTHQRIAAALEAIEQNMSDEHEAVNIDYDNTTSGLNANKVQSAIDELALAGFVTNTVNNLVNYYLKSETYNKAEVDSLINAVKNSRFEAVSTLPTTNIKTNVIYLVPKSPTQTNNAKDEYINLDGTSSGWEKIGDTEVDLSGYVTTTALDTALSNYTTTANLTNLLNNKVDKVSGKGLSTNDYTDTEKQKLSGIETGANKTVVDSALNNTSTNPVQNKVITKELEGAKTTTGNPLTIEDAAPVNAVNLSVDLEPIQDLHGYDHPWVGGAGKNLLECLKTSASTLNDITCTPQYDSDNNLIGYSLVGTATDNADFPLHGQYMSTNTFIPSGTYNIKTFGAVNGVEFHYGYGGSTYTNTNSDIMNTTECSNGIAWVILRVKNGTAINTAITVKPMIWDSTLGEISFASYSNICPISGRTEEVITQKDNLTNPTVTKTYTIQLGDTVYGGQLDVTKGKMVVDRGYIASYNGETLPSSWISDRDVYTSGTTPTIGAEVVYELATPYTIQLTPQQIKLLENTNTIYTDHEGDTITIEYQPNNAIGEAVRVVEESYDPEFAVRPVLKKKAFSGTTDSDGSVTLINASDIPSNHRIIPLQITDMTIDGNAGTYFVEYKPYNSGDSVKGYCYFYMSGSQMFPVGKAITGNFYYYDLEG